MAEGGWWTTLTSAAVSTVWHGSLKIITWFIQLERTPERTNWKDIGKLWSTRQDSFLVCPRIIFILGLLSIVHVYIKYSLMARHCTILRRSIISSFLKQWYVDIYDYITLSKKITNSSTVGSHAVLFSQDYVDILNSWCQHYSELIMSTYRTLCKYNCIYCRHNAIIST